MSDGTNLIYRYDGTLNGLMCCVIESMKTREEPMMILPDDEMQLMLLPEKHVETNPALAARAVNTLAGKLSEEFMRFVEQAHLSALPGREKLILTLIRRALARGPQILNDLSDPEVIKLTRAVNQLGHEAHLYTGFTRFQVNEGVLTAVIEPKNRVLSLLKAHFADRFSGETFLIYDKTHAQALIHHRGKSRIVALEELALPPLDEEEKALRALWRRFFTTVSIGPRENPRQQMTMLPKRYRGQMCEFTADPHTAIS